VFPGAEKHANFLKYFLASGVCGTADRRKLHMEPSTHSMIAGSLNSRSPFDFAQGRLSTSLRSGRDDRIYLNDFFISTTDLSQ
jgi:hypothetical protein